MGVLRSKLGWALVVIYVLAFITVYSHVQAHRGTIPYDIGLDLLALPYILVVGRLLLQQPTFAVHAHEPWDAMAPQLMRQSLDGRQHRPSPILSGSLPQSGRRRIYVAHA